MCNNCFLFSNQISTGTGILSFLVNLVIAVPEAFILGNGDEYHVEQGSTINLVCVIEKVSTLLGSFLHHCVV